MQKQVFCRNEKDMAIIERGQYLLQANNHNMIKPYAALCDIFFHFQRNVYMYKHVTLLHTACTVTTQHI